MQSGQAYLLQILKKYIVLTLDMIKEIRKELKKHADEEYRIGSKKFFKETE